MKEVKLDPLDVVIRMPDDPDNKGAIICSYLSPEGGGATFIKGMGKNVLPMAVMLLDNLMESLDQEQKSLFIRLLGEQLVDMTKGVDGFEAMIIRKKVDADDDEDDQL